MGAATIWISIIIGSKIATANSYVGLDHQCILQTMANIAASLCVQERNKNLYRQG